MNHVTVETNLVHSALVNDDYQLYHLLPSDYSASNSYPLVVFLDGNWYNKFFQKEMASLIESGEIPPCILVGVGYPLDGGYKELCPHCKDEEDDILIPRFRDYTFPTVVTWTIPTGEGDKYASFLNEELVPKIASEYSIDTNMIYLMGHSLGGLSMFYNMFEYVNPKFDGYASVSPSLYWAEGHNFSLEENYHQNHSDLNTKLYIAYGSAESGSLAAHNAEMIERIESRNYPSLKFKSDVFVGSSHRQAAWEGFRKGLIFCLN